MWQYVLPLARSILSSAALSTLGGCGTGTAASPTLSETRSLLRVMQQSTWNPQVSWARIIDWERESSGYHRVQGEHRIERESRGNHRTQTDMMARIKGLRVDWAVRLGGWLSHPGCPVLASPLRQRRRVEQTNTHTHPYTHPYTRTHTVAHSYTDLHMLL
jgi:hypothetical protein